MSQLRVASDGLKGYIGIASDDGMGLVLRNGGDVDGLGDGVGMLEDGGGIICYDKEVM